MAWKWFSQLGTAVVQHFRVNDTSFQRSFGSSRSCARGIKCRCLVGVPDLAILTHVEAGKCKDNIEFVTPPSERRAIAGVVHRIHRTVDGHDEMVADLVLIPCVGQRVEQPLPFGHAG
jgi:hypothetical protein